MKDIIDKKELDKNIGEVIAMAGNFEELIKQEIRKEKTGKGEGKEEKIEKDIEKKLKNVITTFKTLAESLKEFANSTTDETQLQAINQVTMGLKKQFSIGHDAQWYSIKNGNVREELLKNLTSHEYYIMGLLTVAGIVLAGIITLILLAHLLPILAFAGIVLACAAPFLVTKMGDYIGNLFAEWFKLGKLLRSTDNKILEEINAYDNALGSFLGDSPKVEFIPKEIPEKEMDNDLLEENKDGNPLMLYSSCGRSTMFVMKMAPPAPPEPTIGDYSDAYGYGGI